MRYVFDAIEQALTFTNNFYLSLLSSLLSLCLVLFRFARSKQSDKNPLQTPQPTFTPIDTLSGSKDWLNAVASSSCGSKIAAGSRKGELHIWASRSTSTPYLRDWEHTSNVMSISSGSHSSISDSIDCCEFDPLDSRWVATASRNGTKVCIFDVETNGLIGKAASSLSSSDSRENSRMDWGSSGIACLAAYEGNILLSGGIKGEILLWDVRVRKNVGSFTLNDADDGGDASVNHPLLNIKFNPGGSWLVVLDESGKVQTYDYRSSKKLEVLRAAEQRSSAKCKGLTVTQDGTVGMLMNDSVAVWRGGVYSAMGIENTGVKGNCIASFSATLSNKK